MAFAQRLTDEELLAANILPARPARPRNPTAESRALDALVGRINASPSEALQALVETVAELSNAGSSGVSILENDHFTWPAIAGAWAPYVDQGLPKDASPCGVVIARKTALLFNKTELIFPNIDIQPSIEEALLVPIYFDQEPKATLWAISHDSHRFDSEDVRVLERLSLFAAAIDQARRANARERGIADDARERMRNTVAVIRSIVRAESTDFDAPAGTLVLNSRLPAFADGLDKAGAEADLWQMLAHHIILSGERPDDRVKLDGPAVRIPRRAAGVVSLALHELLANAFQHGALARPEGSVHVSWAVSDDGGGRRLRMVWREEAQAALRLANETPGFGHELIQYGLPEVIGAVTALEYRAGGLFVSIEMRLE